MTDLPKIVDRKEIAKTRLFRVETLDLMFSNGVERQYERLAGSKKGHRAVMVVALLDDHHFLLVREYAAGTENYQFSLPKGVVEANETLFEGGNRELKEEAGYGAYQWQYLTELTLSPNYMSHSIQVVVARGLYEEKLEGDEPETMEVLEWSFDQLLKLCNRPDVTEARTLAALFLVKDMLQSNRFQEASWQPVT